ncbi:MAG: ABC-F family ATP-binding cassette domain-containing protein [Waddliaceae bacterium]
MHDSSLQLIKFYSVSKSFGPKSVLSDLSFSISRGERIAVIGENGSGKTTLAKIAAGLESPDHGEAAISESCTVGYLSQHLDPETERNMTLEEYILESSGDLLRISTRLREIEKVMASPSGDEELESVISEWGILHESFLAQGGYDHSERSQACLSFLGLEDIGLDRPFSSLSGGEQRRAALAALLLKQPDFLTLDEPTNHLDLSAIEWLENYLGQYKGGVLLISHDRCFLNRVSNRIFELSSSTLKHYPGNYDDYIATKQKELKNLFEKYQKQQDEISSLKRFLKEQTFSPKRAAPSKDGNKMAYDRRGEKHLSSKRKAISQAKAKLDGLESEKMSHPIPKDYKEIVFRPKPIEANDAIRLENVAIHVAARVLVKDLFASLSPGERVILRGPNGCGKSSLLNTLAHQLEPFSGKIFYSPQGCIGYLTQEPDFPDTTLTIIDYLLKKYPIPEHQLRSQLHQIALIEGRFIGQPIYTLSLGQQRRLQLLELMLSEANILLLDEPTNHLAPLVIDKLEEALLIFPGAVIAATHDRRFAERVGTTYWEW